MEENTVSNLDEIGQAEDSGFASIEGASEVRKPKYKLTSEDLKLSHRPILDETEMISKVSKVSKQSAARKLLEGEYHKENQELFYKKLKHLVSKSKFFSKIIIDKINDSTKPNSNNNKKKKRNSKKTSKTNGDEYTPPAKRSKRIINQTKNSLKDHITSTKSNQIKKLNLSTDEITKELNTDSDDEALNEIEKVDIHLEYFIGQLRDYQKVGLKWLISLYENGLNGILGDEMGLGKTIQVIAMICYLVEKRQDGPFLIIVPLSTALNWLSEFKRFAPKIPVIFLYGNKQKRALILQKINAKMSLSNGYKTLPVILTTYEGALNEIFNLRRYNLRYTVIDEGHRIKNHNAQLSRRVRTLKSISRLILTGTPLHNNLAELWALLNFLMPDIFDDLAVFKSWFDIRELGDAKKVQRFLEQEKEKQVIACLRKILKPFMLRREKDEVCPELPMKKEVIVYTPITELQRELYLAVLKFDYEYLAMKEQQSDIIENNPDGTRPKRKCTTKSSFNPNYSNPFAVLGQSSSSTTSYGHSSNTNQIKPSKMNTQVALPSWRKFDNIDERNMNFYIRIRSGLRFHVYKQIISHPFLIRCPLNDVGLPTINEEMVKASGKLLVLDLMLKKLHSRGHKILIFSTMKKLLDLVADYLSLRPWKFVRLHGTVKMEEREENIEKFNNDPEIFLFLITTRAGGVGLNLAAADTVILYDSDWNPQADIQAMARCHRIGQTKPVVVYRFCSRGTVDDTIIHRAESKRKLEKMVISKELANFNYGKSETILELLKLLESTPHSTMKSENDVYTEAELDVLLDRSDLLQKIKTED